MTNNKFKSGFVAILGRPNVGKSTFMNHVMGQKIAIMSDKPQTTRNKIQGIYTTENEQIVFIDTPGIHKPHNALGDFMVQSAYSTLRECDVVLFMVAADEPRSTGENMIIERLKKAEVPVILVVNKIDKIHPDRLFEIVADYTSQMEFSEVVPISAKQGNNTERLIDTLSEKLDEGPQYFPEDMITDQPERLIISDIVREKILLSTRDEIPHAIAVDVDEMKTRDDGTTYIRATIYCERDSQKGIIIGNKGALLRKIGAEARMDIQKLLATKVYLDLWVKVKKDWRNKSGMLSELGYKK